MLGRLTSTRRCPFQEKDKKLGSGLIKIIGVSCTWMVCIFVFGMERVDSTIILTALGVDLAGNKEVLALRTCAEEEKDGWACLLQDLRSRGATHVDLLVTDGHEGLPAGDRLATKAP